MQMKIHHPKEYSPEEVEAFRQRMEAHHHRQEEYDDPMAGTYMIGYVLIFLAVVAVIGILSWGWWQASDRLVGLGS